MANQSHAYDDLFSFPCFFHLVPLFLKSYLHFMEVQWGRYLLILYFSGGRVEQNVETILIQQEMAEAMVNISCFEEQVYSTKI